MQTGRLFEARRGTRFVRSRVQRTPSAKRRTNRVQMAGLPSPTGPRAANPVREARHDAFVPDEKV